MGKFEDLGKINYIPVLNGGLLNGALRDECMIGGKRATFYTNDAIFKYNKYLINPYHHEDTYIKIPEGLLCEECGQYVEYDKEPPGYPQLCSDCRKEIKDDD